MKIKTFLTAALTFGAFLTVTTVNGAAVDRKDIIEKAQFTISGNCTFGDKLIRTTGKKVLLVSNETFQVNTRQIWLLRCSIRSKSKTPGKVRVGFRPLDAKEKPIGKDIWCSEFVKAGKRWKEVGGGISLVDKSENENITVQWHKDVKNTRVMIEAQGDTEIIEFALEILEE